MEPQQRLVREFSQLRLPPPPAPPLSPRRHTHLPRPASLPRPERQHTAPRLQHSDRLTPFPMDGLVQDFKSALDETAGSQSSERSTGRRKAWKRRCKSTSNLLQAGQNLSEDSSSSLDNFGLLSRDRGTSSLQLSDSDLDNGPSLSGRRNRPGRPQDYRKRHDNLLIESDSFTENISPFKEFRANSKRKRKSKRMEICENVKPVLPGSFVFRSPGQGTKRKKVRSKSGSEITLAKKSGITQGKRKRSAREKSADNTDKKEVDRMETEDVRSSSSLSSSEWEDLGSDLSHGEVDGREADDEYSDWPGPEPGMSVMQLTDEEVDPDVSFVSPSSSWKGTLTRGRSFNSREIKAGTRRLRGLKTSSSHHEGGKKLTQAEIVNRFLQDPAMSSVRVPLTRPSDRNLVLSLASLYSLSWTQESDTTIILTKNTHLSGPVEFAVPGIPKTKDRFKKFEPKRLKQAPPVISSPLSPDAKIENISCSNGSYPACSKMDTDFCKTSHHQEDKMAAVNTNKMDALGFNMAAVGVSTRQSRQRTKSCSKSS